MDNMIQQVNILFDNIVEFGVSCKNLLRDNTEAMEKLQKAMSTSEKSVRTDERTKPKPNDKTVNKPNNIADTHENVDADSVQSIILNEIDKRFKEREDNIKILIASRNANLHRDYKLTANTKFEHFIDFFRSELRSLNLLHIIDESENPLPVVSEIVLKQQIYDVRDRLIGRLDVNYYSIVCDIQDPKEILERLKKLKLSETNLTSNNLR